MNGGTLMKIKLLAFALISIVTLLLLPGCSRSEAITFQLLQGSEVVLTASEDAEMQLKAITLPDGAPLFEDVTVSASKGMFYQSYSVNITTTHAPEAVDYQLRVTMPGKVAQVLNGSEDSNTVTFSIHDISRGNRYALYSDANNTGTVFVILGVLVAFGIAFFFFIKRKQG